MLILGEKNVLLSGLVDQKSNKVYIQRRPQLRPEFGEVSQYL